MAYLPRGIAPDLLLSQVKNTLPYLFEEGPARAALGDFPPAQVVWEFAQNPTAPLDHFGYFRLCLAAHYLTCATPVPTDVDNQIRRKLWPANLPFEIALAMAEHVLASRAYDFTKVTRRFTPGAGGTPWEKETLSGHLGEWFTVAAAAYCALGNYPQAAAAKNLRQDFFDAITDEVRRHSEIFGSLWRANDGLGALKASASVAHNFGDLDRVINMWEVNAADPLRLEHYQLTTTPLDPNGKLRHLGRLWVAGELYKTPIAHGSAMALENHRHFALRKPRCLRESIDLIITTGPFFDDWGKLVARYFADATGQPTEKTREVIEALQHGWERLPKSVGYGRALRGFAEVHPTLRLEDFATNPTQKNVLAIAQPHFEAKWAEEALRQMDEIPSRAP